MIKKITFLQDFRCFQKGEVIDFVGESKPSKFHPTIILVGLNGCGKSTLLRLIANEVKATSGMMAGFSTPEEKIIELETSGEIKARLFDAETDKKRGAGIFDFDDKDLDIGFHVQAMHMSHGETLFYGLNKIFETIKDDKYNTFLLDEPDQAASIRIAAGLARALLFIPIKHPGVQIIAAVHHPIVMEMCEIVYDVVARKFRDAEEVIEEMKQPGDLMYQSPHRKSEPEKPNKPEKFAKEEKK